jgi:hypothetical protein
MVSRREKPVVSTDSHKRREEANRPYSHEDNPCDEEGAEFRDAEDLQVEEGDGNLDEADGKDSSDDEGVIVLVTI